MVCVYEVWRSQFMSQEFVTTSRIKRIFPFWRVMPRGEINASNSVTRYKYKLFPIADVECNHSTFVPINVFMKHTLVSHVRLINHRYCISVSFKAFMLHIFVIPLLSCINTTDGWKINAYITQHKNCKVWPECGKEKVSPLSSQSYWLQL